VSVDGNDPVAVYEAVSVAVERARSGGGPTLLEATAFRYFGHYFGDDQKYLREGELAAAMAADPVPAFRQRMLDNGWAAEAPRPEMEAKTDAALEAAHQAAMAAEAPSTDEIYRDVLAAV